MGCISLAAVDTVVDAVGLFVCQGTLQVHVQLAIYQNTSVLSSRAAPEPVHLQPVSMQWVLPSQVEDLAFVFIKFH